MKQMGNWEKKLTMQVMAALLAGAAMGTTAFAAEAENSNAADTAVDVYELEDTVVTAERMPTKKLETPANTAVITAKEIEDNLHEIITEVLVTLILNSFLAISAFIVLYFIEISLLKILIIFSLIFILICVATNNLIYRMIKKNIESNEDFNNKVIEYINAFESIKNNNLH